MKWIPFSDRQPDWEGEEAIDLITRDPEGAKSSIKELNDDWEKGDKHFTFMEYLRITQSHWLDATPSPAPIEAGRGEVETFAKCLYEHVKHGDEAHRKWLKDEIDSFTVKYLKDARK